MITGTTIKAKRKAADIPGDVVCKKFGKPRSWLSGVEREYLTPDLRDLTRLDAVVDQLIDAKEQGRALAVEMGWPTAVAV